MTADSVDEGLAMLLKGDRPLVEPAEEEGPGLNELDRIEDAATGFYEVLKEL